MQQQIEAGFITGLLLAVSALTKAMWTMNNEITTLKQQAKQTEQILTAHALELQQHSGQFALVMPMLARMDENIKEIKENVRQQSRA